MSTSHNTLDYLDLRGLQATAMLVKLAETFPPLNPTPEETMEKIMYKAGQRSVVEWIQDYMENE